MIIIINFKILSLSKVTYIANVAYLENCTRYYAFCFYHLSYLALIRLLFVELGFFLIKRKSILYYYTTISIYSRSYALLS